MQDTPAPPEKTTKVSSVCTRGTAVVTWLGRGRSRGRGRGRGRDRGLPGRRWLRSWKLGRRLNLLVEGEEGGLSRLLLVKVSMDKQGLGDVVFAVKLQGRVVLGVHDLLSIHLQEGEALVVDGGWASGKVRKMGETWRDLKDSEDEKD
ncbi:hypothetical protein E2C01_009130 [Portunus trituberculatus]|uniref:Uncharacterized protein n=1 Tax=Portunus trituberculatus TaxID=210409 RepID=A0A5B7D3U6_PORTR|nr:hypothetical protein [Portunus trituberculatus]